MSDSPITVRFWIGKFFFYQHSEMNDWRKKFTINLPLTNCIKNPTRYNFSYVFILRFVLYMFRKDTQFIIRSLRITVYAAACTHHADISAACTYHDDISAACTYHADISA